MRFPHSYIWLLDVDTWKNKFNKNIAFEMKCHRKILKI